MRLTFRRYPDGRLRPYWYGEYERNGQRKVATLCSWKGTPPASDSVTDQGDEEFEATRHKALAALRDMVEGQRSQSDKETLVQRIHAARYGTKVVAVPIASLPAKWDSFPRRRKPSTFHRENCHRILTRFMAHMKTSDPSIKELGAVTAEHVRAFMDAEDMRGISPRTWNVTLTVLRAVFKRLEPFSAAWRDYLATTPTKEEATIHREPFTAAEIKDVLDAANEDPFIRTLIIVALCTAMRRGDVCTLRWKHVDLAKGFLTVKTAKTGETVEIPILPMLRDELDIARRTSKTERDAFVFPEAAQLYADSPDSLDRRLKAVLTRAGFVDDATAERMKVAVQERAALPALSSTETRARGLKAIASAQMTEKRRVRTVAIFTRYMDGQSVRDISTATQSSKGIVSMRLADVGTMIGAAVIRQPSLSAIVHGSTLAKKDGDTQRMKRGSLKGWHSFRTTWITLALSAGVPMELVRRVTGHASADVVLKHYFRPGREQFRVALQSAMPTLMLNGKKETVADAITILRASTAKTWTRDRAKAIDILEGAA